MKKKTTMNYITGSFEKVWRCGYCDLYYIMKGVEPEYYNAGIYGWNCDVYIDWLHDTAISTGYRNMRGERIPAELLEKYSRQAEEIVKNNFNFVNYEEYEKQLNENRREFFAELARA